MKKTKQSLKAIRNNYYSAFGGWNFVGIALTPIILVILGVTLVKDLKNKLK